MTYNRVQEEKNHYNEKYNVENLSSWRYDWIFNSAHIKFIEWIEEIVKENRSIKILDIGCGDGRRTRFLGEYPNVELVGIDISEVGIKVANENKIGQSTYQLMDAEHIVFSPNSFDLIIDYGSFSSLNMNAVWLNLKKILKPNGSIIGIETLGHNPIFNLKRLINVKLNIRTNNVYKRIIKFKQLFKWSNECNNFKYQSFGLITPILTPLGLIIPESRILKKLISVTDYVEKSILLRLKFCRKFCFKIVFQYQGFK